MSAPRGGALTWRRVAFWMTCGLLCEACAALAGLCFGSSGLSPGRLVQVLFTSEEFSAHEAMILTFARVPRVWFAAIVGAALASAGAVFQAILRNPLADPYILGVSGGGALMATLYLTLGGGGLALGGMLGLSLASLLGAAWSVALLLLCARWIGAGRAGVYVLLLLGVVFNAFASSIITLMKAIVSAQKAQELLFYLMGTLSVEGTPREVMLGASVAVAGAIVMMCVIARELNVLALGDAVARSLGVEVARVRLIAIIAASVAVAVAVAYTGLIGFVGLIVPHALRLLVGSDHRLLVPLSACVGAAFLTLSDVIARVGFDLFSMTLPVGVITSLIGAPIFVLLLRQSFVTRRA